MSCTQDQPKEPEGADVTSALLRLAETIAGHTRLDTLLPMIVKLASTVIGCPRCLLSLWDDDRACFVPAAAYGLSPRLERLFYRQPITPGDVPLVDQVVRSRQPVLADIHAPLIPEALRRRLGGATPQGPAPGADKTILGVPLLHHDQVIGGMILIHEKDRGGFGPREIALANGIARQTALAVASAHAFEAERRRQRDLEALQETIALLTAELEFKALYQRIVERAAVTFAAPAAALFLWDETSESLPPSATHGLSEKYAQRQRLPTDLIRDLLQARPDMRPFALPDLRLSPLGDPDLIKAEGLRAALVIPLRRGNRFLGLISVYERAESPTFDDDALALAQALAHQTVIALENARLYQQAQDRSRQLSAVLTTGHEVRVNQDPVAILQHIAEGIQRGLGWRAVLITRYDHDAGLAYGVASAGVSRDALERLYSPSQLEHRRSLYERERYRISRSYFVPAERGGSLIAREPTAWVAPRDCYTGAEGWSIPLAPAVTHWPSQATAGVPESADDDSVLPSLRGGDAKGRTGEVWQPNDFLIVPIQDRHGDVLGTISVDAPHHGRRPTLADVQTLEIFADQAAVALENTRLFQIEQRRATELSGLADIAAAFGALTDLGETYRRVTQTVAHLLGAEKCGVVRFSDDMQRAWAESPAYGFQEAQISHAHFQITPEMVTEMKSAKGTAIIANDMTALPPSLASLSHELGVCNALAAFFARRGQITGMLVAANKPDGFSEDDAALLTTVAHQATIAIENARLFKSEQARRRQLEGLQATIAALSAELHLDPLLQLIAAQTAAIFDASAAAVLMWDEAWEQLVVRAHHGLPKDFARRFRLPYGRLRTELDRSPDSDLFTIYDLTGSEQLDTDETPSGPTPIMGAVPGSRSALLCALQMGGQLIGALVVYSDRPRRFHTDEKALARTLSQQAAIAIENAQFYTTLQTERERLRALSARLTQAQETERARIARELHDEAGQALTAVRLQLDFVASILPPDLPPPVREQIDEAQALVSRTLEEIRRISIDLRPSLLDDLGLTPALRWQCAHFSRHANLEVRFESKGEIRRLGADVETAVYRAAQEALTNIARHAQATSAEISLDYQRERLRMTITDNGRGFLSITDQGMGLGLVGMQERIAAVGGKLHIDSQPEAGSTLQIEVPLQQDGILV